MVLEALSKQSLNKKLWELLIVDNNCTMPIEKQISLSWHYNAIVIKEDTPGLSYARIKGVKNCKTGLIVFVDDDNVLEHDYLQNCLDFSVNYPNVGCFGGKSIPVFETKPPEWLFKTGINLGCQDFGEELFISNYAQIKLNINSYPEKAPIGTGMAIQKKAFMTYVEEVNLNPERLKLGRKKQSLASGEDNDIILTLIKKGYEIAYVPSLIVNHLIPFRRYSKGYLEKMAYESNRTWVKVLALHKICPWKRINKATLPFRNINSFIKTKAWSSVTNYINWKSSCGVYKGLTEI